MRLHITLLFPRAHAHAVRQYLAKRIGAYTQEQPQPAATRRIQPGACEETRHDKENDEPEDAGADGG